MPTSSASITGPGRLIGRAAWVHNKLTNSIAATPTCTSSARPYARALSLKLSIVRIGVSTPRLLHRLTHQPNLGYAGLLQQHHHLVNPAVVDAIIAADQHRCLWILPDES